MRVGVLVSGSGTILAAIIAAGQPVEVVISDRVCAGLQVAKEAGIDAVLLDRREFGGFGPDFDRTSYTKRIVEVLLDRKVDVVAMAGFGTVLEQPIHDAYPGRVLNTHPALLPAFPGWHAVEDALAAGASATGCTVHLATLLMDEGPILAQRSVEILPGDTVETLHERIKTEERELYPATIRAVVAAMERGAEPVEISKK